LIDLKIFGATFGIGGGAIAPYCPPWLRAWQEGWNNCKQTVIVSNGCGTAGVEICIATYWCLPEPVTVVSQFFLCFENVP